MEADTNKPEEPVEALSCSQWIFNRDARTIVSSLQAISLISSLCSLTPLDKHCAKGL